MIHFVVPRAGDFTLREYLEFWGRKVAARAQILHYERLAHRREFAPGTYVLTALDRLNPPLMRLTRELHAVLAGADGVRVLNHPSRTLQRFQLLGELHRLGLNRFRAFRVTDDFSSLRYPVFLREERSHDGPITPLLDSPKQLETAIGRALLQGRKLADLLTIEFLDTADTDGYYRKYAAYMVGERIIPRNLAWGKGWMLKHSESEFTPEMILEERDYVFGNPHREQLATIFEAAGVGYGRIDYAIQNGSVQTWEINLNPTIGRGIRSSSGSVPEHLQSLRFATKAHFYEQFAAAFDAVDCPGDATAPIPTAFQPQTVRDALASVDTHKSGSRPRRRGKALREWLQPLKIVLEPLATPFLPLLGRLARRKTDNR